MKVFLVDSYKVNIYSLPTKVEDAYLINYTNYSGVDETIALIARDNKWYIESTPDVAISKHNLLVEKDAIEDNNIYEVKFSDLNEIVMLYCYDTPIDYATYEVGNRNIVTLGRAGSYDVLYENTYVYSPHLKIYFDKGSWILEDNGFERTAVYLNNYRVRKAVLHMGDVIFTNGLKIIWLDSFIKVNNPNNAVKSTLSVYQRFGGKDSENVYTPVKDTEKAIVLYNDNQVFFHTPRMKAEIKETIISIDSPPDEIKDESPPAILTLGATIMMGISSSLTGVIAIFSVATGRATLLSSITEITICLSMLVGTIMFPVLLDRYQKKKLKKKEKLRQTKYMTYLDSKRKEIQDAILLETKILYENNLSILECQNNLINKTNKVWSREIQDNDFLTIRLGIGDKNADIKIEAHKKDFSMDDDNLRKEVEKILNEKQILKNVPITVSLIQNKVLPIIIDNTYYYRQSFIDSILLQIITYYSGADLKLVVFTNQDNASRWEYLKYLPHCCSDDRKTRFFATNEDEMKQLSTYLEREFQSRWDLANNKHQDSLENEDIDLENEDDENIYAAFDKYYLIITDNFVNSKGYGIIDKVVNRKQNVGFSLMMIEPNMANIPSKINKFIEVNNNVAHILGKDLSESDQNNFVPELFNGDITLFANILANIPVSSTNMINSLPTTINFLEMYKVGKIEQLNILNRWTNNNPTISLHAPVGVHEDGKLFEIDLHEKFHGPHGLVAGATGSGKSEFIITYILSMALNYHPYEVQFVLIDYKGGGLAGAFENKESGIKLPHLAGTITNLDTGEMNRTLVSINSELKRRQRMFNEARDALNESTVDIYKYQRFYREGKVKEPISHLFIISDEFAELKAQQPDFMNELVSTARIGRSLGVHLILATQKPAGVVDDQIWSNSRFKVCLKVQTAEDSMELLKRSDAAEIKETGRFYLQVGFNELFELGQSAWAGARYIPTDRILKSIDDSINFIDNNGNIIKRVNDSVKVENQTNYGDQLTNIVGALYNIAIRENVKFNQLWLPSISKEIYLSQIVNKYGYSPVAYEINPIIGEYDNPASQFQGLLTVDLTNKGNLLIVGNAGSGKENLLTTLIYSTCLYHSSEEVNFYILDYGAEVLRIFNNVAHVGDVAVVDDDEKIKGLLLMLDREQKKRKDLFAEYGGGYTSYIKNSGNKLPLIVVVLNGYESFVENYAKYDDILVHLLRDSSKYGIVFVMTAIAINSVRSSLQQLFNNKIALQLSDSFDYKYYLNAPDNMTPSKYFGRGIVAMDDTAYEFQTAYVYLRDNINDVIKDFAIKLSKVQKKVPKIPVIPSIVNADSLTPYIEEVTNVPIGFNMDDASVCKYDFTKNKITQITGNYIIRDNTFVQELIKVLSTVSNIKFKIIDFVDYVSDFDGLDYSNGNFTDTIKNIIKTEQEESKTIVYLFVGIGHIYDKVLDEGILTLFNIFSNIDKFLNSYFIIADNYSSYKRIMKEEWYLNFVNKSSGIWVGTDVSVQNAILFDNLSKADSNEDFSSLAYADSDNDYSVIKAIGANERNDLY